MGAITLDEYNKKKKENSINTSLNVTFQNNKTSPNTILFSDYKSKYGNNKMPTEVTMAGNSVLLPTIEQTQKVQQEEPYIDTGKTYGDYWYQEYGTRKNDKIYSKGGKYYVLNSRTGEYDDVDRINYMTDAKTDEQQLATAQSLGYKGNKTDLVKISNKILLDTGDLTKKEYAEYTKDLQRQEEKLSKEQQEKTQVRYSGTGIDALKQVGSAASDLAYKADKEVIAPIKSVGDNYNIGKKNNELALEYYKKMEGKKNNAEKLEEKINKYNRYNQDLITDPGAAGTAIQNMDTQVQSALKSGLAAGALGLGGAIIGGVAGGVSTGGVGAIPGAIAGFKTGAGIGYTIGGVPYTYKLEAGNQYKDLVEQGIPEKIAKDLSKKTGAINAVIESGENLADLITFGAAGKLTNAPEQALYESLKREYGEKALKTLILKSGYSYVQNILSESAEEMAQEGTSIYYERKAFEKAGLERNVTDEEDINRILQAGKSAAISTAFTAPITSVGGTIANTVVTKLQTTATNKVNTLTRTEINSEIRNQVLNATKENNTSITGEEVLAIQQKVNQDIEQSNIKVIENETQTKEQIQNRISELQEQLQAYKELNQDGVVIGNEDAEIRSITKEIQQLQQQLKSKNILPTVEDIVNQEKANKETLLPTRELTFAESVKQNNINIDSATIQEIQRVMNERGIKSRFDASMFDNNTQEALWTISTDDNGNVTREVIFNPNATDSSKYLQNLTVHELYHDIASTQQGQVIQTELLDYVSRIDGYQEARQNLESTYAKLTDTEGNLLYNPSTTEFKNMIDEEVIASVLGEKLGNQQFVSNLNMQKPSIARQIYNWVVDKLNSLNKLTGYKNEKLFWTDVKNKFDNAYRMQYNSNQQLTNATRFAATRENNPYGHTTKFIDLDQQTQSEAHRVISTKALKLLNEGKAYGMEYDINGNLYTFEILSDGTYRITDVDLYNTLIEEVADETNPNRNSKYSMEGTIDGQSNIDGDNESNQNGRTSQENVRISTEESEQPRNNGYRLSDTKQKENNRSGRELDNSSFSLKQRVSGDLLLDAQDLIEEVKSVGAEVDENGYVTVYHQTTEENAQKIRETGKMTSKERDVFFSTSKDASQSEGRGNVKLEFKIPAEKLVLDDIFSDNADVKIQLDNKGYLNVSNYLVEDNNLNVKQQQLDIINKSNPSPDDVHTWIRNAEDIKSFSEAFFEDGEFSGMDPDFTESMANEAIETGKVKVYSSYPIENGTFVSPSQMEASQYAGGDASKLYSKTVNINDVAWIDGAEGQYAKVESNTNNLITNLKDNEGRTLTKEQQDYFKNSKIVDQDGSLQVVYHTMTESKLPFHEFNPIGTEGYKFGNQVVNFFTDNQEMSGSYAENEYVQYNNELKNKNYYQYSGYINIENPYIIDANFSEWNKIPNDSNLKIKQNQKYININDIVKSVLEMNENNSDYDGIIVKNLYDYATDYDIYENEAGNVYVTFKSNQFKDINNVKPTTNDDIRYSNKNTTWDEFTQNNFKTDGTGERLQDVLLPTKKGINLPTNEDTNLRSLEENAKKQTYIDKNFKSLEEIAPKKYKGNNIEKNIPLNPTKESSYDNNAPNFWENDNIDKEINEFKRSLDREMEDTLKSPKKIKENNDLKRKIENMYGDFQEKFVNRNYEIDKLSKQTGNKEIMFKGDMLNSVAGETSGDINVAQTDNYGKRIGNSLKSLFENSKKNGYYEQFDDYLKHYSNIDRHAYGKGSVVPLEYSQKMVQAYEQSIPGIKNDATKVWQYGKNILNNLEENGLISSDLKGTLEEIYPHYVPYMQSEYATPYMDDSGEIKPNKVIKRAKGGAHDLVTIEEAYERYTYAAKKAIRKNDLYKEIVKSSKEKVSYGADDRIDPTNLDSSLMRDAEGNGVLTAYVDGVQQQAKINDNLYQELTKANELKVRQLEEKYSPIVKPLQKISEIRRNVLTTWNPWFTISNPIKDIQDGMFNSKYTKDMIKNYPGAFYELATQNTEIAQQFTSLYGSGMVMGDYQIDKLSNGMQNMDINQVNKLIKALPNANEIVELAPRYAEFKASLENGCSITEAMYNAREVTTNFNRGGYITKALNRDGFTFLNASVQGFDKLIRNITGVNGSKGVVVGTTSLLLKVTALGIAPAMFNAMAFGEGSDDEDEDYKALPNYIKDNYYLIKVKGLGGKETKNYDGTFIRIPKGRVLSIFGSAARRTLNYANGDKDAFDGYLKNVESQIGINNPEENNIFAPIKQAFGSKNGEAWYGGDLVPKRLQNKPVSEQYDEGTDEFSKWLGKMINVSPYKINYLLDQYGGGASDIILPMITKETTNGATTFGDYLLAPVKDKFVVNSIDDNKYASNFYTSLEKAQTKANGTNASTEDKLKYKYMSSISSQMSNLYKEKREIQLDDSLTKKQKYKKVQNIQKEINKLAEQGTKDYKVKDLKSNYGKIADTEYYKNNKGEWSKVKEEESAELNSLKMSANEKNKYFVTKNKISTIKANENLSSTEKKEKISNLVIGTNLSDEKMAYLYGKYYSKEETLNNLLNLGISIREFIKYNSQEFESDYYTNGKVVTNSKKKKVISYINSLNLSAVQKAMLIKMEYSSFNSYDKQIIQYVNNRSLNMEDKKEILTSLGFKIRNGRVYSK